MSPRLKLPSSNGPVRGSGPGGRVEIGDIQSKLGEIRGDIDDKTQAAKPVLTYAAVAGVVLLVAAAFVLGRKKGRRASTWVEVRRL